MSRMIFAAFAVTTFFVSCSSLKPISTTTNSKQTPAQSSSGNKKEVKFLDISSSDDATLEAKVAKKEVHTSGTQYVKSEDIISYDNERLAV
mgnify:CR=1 FL=1